MMHYFLISSCDPGLWCDGHGACRDAYAINQDGWLYTNENIEILLAKRHFIKKNRNATHRHHIKGASKRTAEDDEKITVAFEQLLDKVIDFQ